MAARPSNPAQNKYSYIPPSVQKAMSQHMERSMPAHLKKYQQGQGNSFMPQHAEKAFSQHLKKNLPSHLKKYADPYLQQHVVYPSAGGASSPAPSTARAGTSSAVPHNPRQVQSFSAESRRQSPQTSGPPPSPPDGQNQDPYGFIMDPQKPPRRPLFFSGNGMTQRIIFAASGLLLLIILMVVAGSFLNKASNAQSDRLITLIKTQSEIVRVADSASDKISDKNLLYKSISAKLSVESSKQQAIAALAKRGKQLKDKQLSAENPANDAALTEGEQNGRFDETYEQLLEDQLADYQRQLKDVYDSGNSTEKDIMDSANEQINLLLGTKASR